MSVCQLVQTEIFQELLDGLPFCADVEQRMNANGHQVNVQIVQ